MRNIDENVKEINQMLIEMIKSSERMLKVSIELLNGDVFNKELYGEVKVLEEELNEYQIKKAANNMAAFCYCILEYSSRASFRRRSMKAAKSST